MKKESKTLSAISGIVIITSAFSYAADRYPPGRYHYLYTASSSEIPAYENGTELYNRIIEIGELDNRAKEHAEYLVNEFGGRRSGSPNLQKACVWALRKFESIGLDNTRMEKCGIMPGYVFFNIIKFGRVPVYNVMGDITGAEFPDEYVIVGAHIDSDDAGDGATDNGIGVAATIEAARILIEAGARPKRTIRFVLFSGEEDGKVGSKDYLIKHKDEIPGISAMLNMDQGPDYISGIPTTAELADDFKSIFAPVMDLHPDMPFILKRVSDLTRIQTECCGGIGSSDHGPFLEAGVPAFSWEQGGMNRSPYCAHSKEDKFDKIIPEYLEHSAVVIAVGAMGIADLDNPLPRESFGFR